MKSSQAVYIRTLSKQQLLESHILAGLSAQSMRKMLIVWFIFCVVVSTFVLFAPSLSQNFTTGILVALLLCTLLILWQSRLNEGWPSLICDENAVGVVLDPQKRRFIYASYEAIDAIESALIKPNKKALEIKIKQNKLCHDSKNALAKAMLPRDDRIIVHVYKQNRVEICQSIREMMNTTATQVA